MRNYFFSAALLLFYPFIAKAAPLDPTGVPAAASGIIHFDLDAAAKSPFFEEIQKSLLRNLPQIETLKTEFGVSSDGGISSITIALIPSSGTEHKTTGDPPRHFRFSPHGIILLRGEFAASKIMAGAIKKDVRLEIIHGHAFLDASSLAFSKSVKKIVIGALDNNTLLIADTDVIKSVIQAFADKNKSRPLPKNLLELTQQKKTPIVSGYLEKNLFYSPPKTGVNQSQPNSIFFHMSDNGQNVDAYISMEFPTPIDARKARADFQKVILFHLSGLPNGQNADNNPPPEKSVLQGLRTKLLDAIEFPSTGSIFDVKVAFPTADSLVFLKAATANPQKKQTPPTKTNPPSNNK
ncbi:MAG: hypothetical protein LBS59_00055 [Puniceicoccales bacterium]|jgi:hypothetical protein|nr:hypothetical protein [Puniceicoccales bacterium]